LVRYILNGQDVGGAIHGPANVSSFAISIVADGHPSDRMRALLYAPGCEIQTLDLKLVGPDVPRYSFVCQPVRDWEINGALARLDRLWRHKVKFEVRYFAEWMGSFLGLADTLVTSIPVGDEPGPSADGSVHLLLPDFSQSDGRSGEFRIVAKDEISEAVVARLIPPKSMRTRMGGLRVENDHPGEFIFTPCAVDSAHTHDQYGFALRPDVRDSCGPF